MKKRSVLIIVLLLSLMCSACVDFFPLSIDGTLESEDPKIRITLSEDPTKFGSDGELTLDDGTVVKIVFVKSHGSFTIYEFNENGEYGPDCILFKGKYRQKGDTLRLILDDDAGEIMLEKVADGV